MTLHSPVAIQPASGDPSIVITAQEYRRATDAMLSANVGIGFNSANFPSLGGVADCGFSGGANTGGFVVTQRGAGANFSVDVAPGLAYVIGTDVTTQGTYQVWNDGPLPVNVATPSAPASGTRNHRLVLQIQDKLENGFWTGYQAALNLLAGDSSGNPPAQGPSAITLAIITIVAGQASVTNANITDYRRGVGPVECALTSARSRGSTSLTDDPDLQLWGLQNAATYQVTGTLFYHGANMTASSDPGGLSVTFRASGASGGSVMPTRFGTSQAAVTYQALGGLNAFGWGATINAVTNGTGSTAGMQIDGLFTTGNTPPNNYLVLQWGLVNASGTNTTIELASLRAVRVA